MRMLRKVDDPWRLPHERCFAGLLLNYLRVDLAYITKMRGRLSSPLKVERDSDAPLASSSHSLAVLLSHISSYRCRGTTFLD